MRSVDPTIVFELYFQFVKQLFLLWITAVIEVNTLKPVSHCWIFLVFVVEFIQLFRKLVQFDFLPHENTSSSRAKSAKDTKAIVAVLQRGEPGQTGNMILLNYNIDR